MQKQWKELSGTQATSAYPVMSSSSPGLEGAAGASGVAEEVEEVGRLIEVHDDDDPGKISSAI